MDGIADILSRSFDTTPNNYEGDELVKKPNKTLKWQDESLECIKALVDGAEHRSSIFKCYKQDARSAALALSDCKELGKLYALYYFKVYSEIRKKYE